jgi:hypothetical protein
VTSLNFPSIAPDPTAPEQLIVDFTNSSTVTSVAATSVTQGSNTFNVAPGNCSIIPEEATCGVSVTFTPTKTGTCTGELIASYPSSQSGTTEIVIALTGTSAAGAPSVTLVPGSVAFPPTGLGASSVTETVTVQNNGDAAGTLSGRRSWVPTRATSRFRRAPREDARLGAGRSRRVRRARSR